MKPTVSELAIAELGPDLQDPEVAAAVRALWPGRKNLFPLVPQELTFKISGVPPAVPNALQGIMMEVPGYALHVEVEDITPPGVGVPVDPFMAPEFLQLVLQNIPLRYGLEARELEEVTFQLEVRNETSEVLTVSAGDLKTFRGKKPEALSSPLFNPTSIIAYVQPARCLQAKNIRIVESSGRMFANAAAAIRGFQRPLDLPELPRERTHRGIQGDAQRCGFAVNVMAVEARVHRVGVTIPVAARGSLAAKRLPARACNQILRGFRTMQGVIERGEAASQMAEAASVQEDNNYWVVSEAAMGGGGALSQGVLNLRGETRAFLELVRVELCSFVPDLVFVGADEQKAVNSIKVTVKHACAREDLGKIMLQVVRNLIDLFTDLGRQFGEL